MVKQLELGENKNRKELRVNKTGQSKETTSQTAEGGSCEVPAIEDLTIEEVDFLEIDREAKALMKLLLTAQKTNSGTLDSTSTAGCRMHAEIIGEKQHSSQQAGY